MNKINFIKKINAMATAGCAVPLKLNEKYLDILIDNAYMWLREEYHFAVTEEYLIIDHNVYQSEEFSATRQIPLPENVYSVVGVREINSRHSMGDFSIHTDRIRKFIYGSFTNDGVGAGSSDLPVYIMSKASYMDFLSTSLTLDAVSYNFNHHSHMLTITGRNPSGSTASQIWTFLDVEQLYSTYIFQQLVLAKVLYEFEFVFSVIDVNLIGGYRINSDAYSRKADKIMEYVNKKVEDSNSMSLPPSFF